MTGTLATVCMQQAQASQHTCSKGGIRSAPALPTPRPHYPPPSTYPDVDGRLLARVRVAPGLVGLDVDAALDGVAVRVAKGELGGAEGPVLDEWITSRRKGGGQMSQVPFAVRDVDTSPLHHTCASPS